MSRPHIHLTAAHSAAIVFTGLAASFAVSFFVGHHEAAGHGLDITAPLALERICACIRALAD